MLRVYKDPNHVKGLVSWQSEAATEIGGALRIKSLHPVGADACPGVECRYTCTLPNRHVSRSCLHRIVRQQVCILLAECNDEGLHSLVRTMPLTEA